MEINGDISLSLEQKNLVDMHSVLNVMNLIIYEFYSLSEHFPGSEELRDSKKIIQHIADDLRNKEKAIEDIKRIRENRIRIESNIRNLLERAPQESVAAVKESVENIETIFSVLMERAEEIITRFEKNQKWVQHDIATLKTKFGHVFDAISKNSKGNYQIVSNLAQQDEKDYYVDLQISGSEGNTITMPLVFQDVMRDLIANARKYTSPGGKILAGLCDDGKSLRFVVEDSGMGIPEKQLEMVIQFGYRAPNVQEKRTMGGGFGLTKAYYITRRYGGRMWITSEIERCTRIEIRIPKEQSDTNRTSA